MVSLDLSTSSVVSLVMWNTRAGEQFGNSVTSPEWQVSVSVPWWLQEEFRQMPEHMGTDYSWGIIARVLGVPVGKLDRLPLPVLQAGRESAQPSSIPRGCVRQVLWPRPYAEPCSRRTLCSCLMKTENTQRSSRIKAHDRWVFPLNCRQDLSLLHEQMDPNPIWGRSLWPGSSKARILDHLSQTSYQRRDGMEGTGNFD